MKFRKFDIKELAAMGRPFDLVFENKLEMSGLLPKTIGEILFNKLTHRDEDSNIILSHLENNFTEISLKRLRHIVVSMLESFDSKNILAGQTVMVLTFHGCNEMITALFFIALATRGCRTVMPMYSERNEFSEWVDLTKAEHIILPGAEVWSLEGHEKEKTEVKEITEIARARKIKVWDTHSDFGMCELISGSFNPRSYPGNRAYDFLKLVTPDNDVLIVTTSGSSGKSKLVVYRHEAYFYNCLAWDQAGFYKKEILGGTGFTPLLTHTMGIRALVNALWTGNPVCLIITEWFISKPETVRYLLLKMMPEHITGGPAVYNIFLELFRVFPEMKPLLGNNMKTLVSSGAAYDQETAREVLNATGLRLHNAFGTTETQQIFSTLLSTEAIFSRDLVPLGRPLPGVSIGLLKAENEKNHFRMFVKSMFGHKYCIGEEPESNSGYFDTGDIISLDNDKNFFYLRRASNDYFKDGFGVKIPVHGVRGYYKDLLDTVVHCEFYAVINFPGLAALLFIKDDSIPSGPVTDSRVMKRYSGYIEEINNRISNDIEPFEYQHRHICRIALINESPPLTGKGTISKKQINTDYNELIKRLTDTRKESAGIESTDALSHGSSKYSKYISPQIGTLLSALKLNYQYEYGEKDSLYTHISGHEVEVLDVTGGYGTNLLGHNNPEIINAVRTFLSEKRISICNQLSIQNYISLLAEKLNLLIGRETGKSYMVIFGNSGSEAVEIAIHHAYFEWERRIEKMKEQQFQVFGSDRRLNVAEIWKRNNEVLANSGVRIVAVAGSFHGHTTGSRSILGHLKKRTKFSRLSNIKPVFIDDRSDNWPEELRNALEGSLVTIERVVQEGHEIKTVPCQVSSVIAAFAEPVMGEGGVRELSRDLLEELSKHDFPLVSDEIQCGLGRTGEIPECRFAHYYLFGKALGGGIEKISAVLIDRTRFCFNFSEYFTSTFGNGELAASASLAVLDVIGSGSIASRAKRIGIQLKEKLSETSERYPDVISEITGKGLMLAISFNKACGNDNLIIRVLFEKEKAGYLFSAWLLNRHRIRMFPTISAPDKLRVEPSACLTGEESGRICLAIEELCRILRGKRMYDLFSFLMDDDPFIDEGRNFVPDDFYNQNLEVPEEGSVRTALVAHFAFPLKELRMLVPDFTRASDTGLRILFNRFQVLMEREPVKMFSMNLFHGKIHFSFWVIPLDSAEMEFLHKSGKRRQIVSKIQKAVDLAAADGAKIISLGGYNSILTNNGLALTEPADSRVVTGNTLTAAVSLAHLGNTIRQNPEFNKRNIIAIIGSTGNIGQVVTEILSEQKDICSELILVSRSEKRQASLVNEIRSNRDPVRLRCTSNIYDVRDADVLVICTNTNDPIILPHHIAPGKPVLITDMSVPSAVSPDVSKLDNVRIVPFSSYVTLPADEKAVISSYSPRGTVFCCAAEAILLGLENFTGNLKGRILPEEVKEMTILAGKLNLLSNMGNLTSFIKR